MAKSLQQIEDYYLRQGLRGEDLRKVLEDDTEFQQLLKERKAVIRNGYGITEEEEKKYLLPNQEDYEVLSIIKTLENKDLSDHDQETVELIKAQLTEDWRTSLLENLRKLLRKY